MHLRLHGGRQLLRVPEHGLPLLLLLIATGCGGSTPERVAEAPGSSTGAEPPPPGATRQVRPSIEALEAIASGEPSFTDPARGVVFILYATDASGEDPRAGEDGIIRTAERACGDRLTERMTYLSGWVRARLEAAEWRPRVRCADAACELPAMGEYDLTATLTFAPEGAQLRLQSVVMIEGGPVTEAFREAGRAFADRRLAELAGGACE